MTPRTCEYCGGPNLRHPNARYCSPEHKSQAYSERKLEARHAKLGDRVCKKCGGPIEEKKHPRTVFCSGRCQREWANSQHTIQRSARRAAARAGRYCAAPGCHNPIPAGRNGNALYCSEECNQRVIAAGRQATAPTYMRFYLYGITPAQWDAQMAAQDYRCIVCRSGLWPGKGNRPHAEHDHTRPVFTLRGIACGNCNLGMGKLGDDPLRLIAAARYLLTAKANPAGTGRACDDPNLLAAALRTLAAGDPALLRAAADYLEAALTA